MTDTPHVGEGASPAGAAPIARFVPRRSFGLKLMLVSALAVIMSIPALFVFAINLDRSSRADQAVAEVSQARGGAQSVVGPFLVAPYDRDVVETVPDPDGGPAMQRIRTVSGPLVLYAKTGAADVRVTTEILHRGIHDVPVFAADAAFTARFELADAVEAAPADAAVRWEDARIYLGLSDLRGARAGATATIDGEAIELTPADNRGGAAWSRGHPAGEAPALVGDYSGLRLVATPPIAVSPAQSALAVEARLAFTGAERLALTAFAQDTSAAMSGDWPSPSFGGGFSPAERDWGEQGFSASWRVRWISAALANARCNSWSWWARWTPSAIAMRSLKWWNRLSR